jgi:polysaccharide export outer membrane protein
MKMNLPALFSRKSQSLFLLLPLLPLLAWMLAGCAGTNDKGLYDPLTDSGTNPVSVARSVIGDTLVINFTGTPDPLPVHEEIIKEDGKITLPDIGSVAAAGRTSGELQAIIHDAYVPKYYTRLTVTVKTGDRLFYVRGELKNPGRQMYTGPITLSKAIATAGDFTETAKLNNVVLTRAGGQRYTVDCRAIIAGKKRDPDIYPGDIIEVKIKGF